MPFLPPNQQRQSTEGKENLHSIGSKSWHTLVEWDVKPQLNQSISGQQTIHFTRKLFFQHSEFLIYVQNTHASLKLLPVQY